MKSYFLDDTRSMRRKAQEAVMAMLLEARYNKTQLMHGYINEIYLGQDGDRAIHGFGLASRFYFGKPVDELELPEIALLVGIVRGPSFYNPRTQPQRATERRNFVLARLAELKVVTEKEAAAAAKKPLGIVPRVTRSYYPAYLDYVRRELQRDFDADALNHPGLNVFTSLDPRAQAAIGTRVATELARLEPDGKSKKHPLETALVVTRRTAARSSRCSAAAMSRHRDSTARSTPDGPSARWSSRSSTSPRSKRAAITRRASWTTARSR